jgi:CheY-like chemotaxis protein
MAILIVEDDFNSREGLRLSLMAEGYQVEAVKDGLQAIKRVLDRRFAVAIVDINLPAIMDVTITGWDLVRIFRSIDPAMSIFVVSAEEGVELQARQAPDARFLRKPINPSQLKAMLKTMIPSRGVLRHSRDPSAS